MPSNGGTNNRWMKRRANALATAVAATPKWPKAVRRCVVFFGTVCVLPVLLVLLVTADRYVRPFQSQRTYARRPDSIADAIKRPHSKTATTTLPMTATMRAVDERMQRRRDHLKRTCRNLGLDRLGNDTLHRPNAWEFLVDRKHKLVWCNVFKAASTSWMYNFNLLAGYSPQFLKRSKLVPLNLARQRYPRPTLQQLRAALNDSIAFLIVRHPLERLLSAYRDKLQYALPHTHHRKLGNEIVVKYRKKNARPAGWQTKEKTQQRWPTFPEFVDYLLDAVADRRQLDMHWTPIVEFCTPCLFDFDVIAHTETLQDDQEYLIRKAHLSDLIKPQWKNAGRGTSTTAEQIDRYYSQLTRSQILRLYNVYRYDFELFNYSISGYLDVGRLDTDPSELLDAVVDLKSFPSANGESSRRKTIDATNE